MPPQSAYAHGAAGEMLADFVVRLETLEDDIAQLSERLGAKLSVPKLNNAPNTQPIDNSAELRAAVQSIYAIDFAQFGYDAEGVSGPVQNEGSERTRQWALRSKTAADLAIADFRPDLNYAELPQNMRWARPG